MTSRSTAPGHGNKSVATLLDGIIQHVPMDGHDGRSGARLERVVLDDGRRLVLKHVDPATDLGMLLTGDYVVREAALWEAGVLDRLPTGVGHAIVGIERGEHTLIVMRDLGDAVLGWRDPLGTGEVRRIVGAMTLVHQAFADINAPELCDLETLLGAFHPDRLNAVANQVDNPLPRIALRGWEAMAQLLPSDLFDSVEATAVDPTALATTLRAAGTALLHADPWPVNIALCNHQVVLLDWGLATAGPGALDLSLFLWGASGCLPVSPETVLDEFRAHAQTTHEATLDASLFAALVLFGWDKAAMATMATSEERRAAAMADLSWWTDRCRAALELGHVPARQGPST